MSQEIEETLPSPSEGAEIDELEPAESVGFKKKIDRIAYRLFGSYFKKRKRRYSNLNRKINQARMEVGYDMYMSRLVLYSIFVGLFGAALGALAGFFLGPIIANSVNISLTLPQSVATTLGQYKEVIAGGVIAFFVTLVLSGATAGIMYYIPSFKAGERKRRINSTLPHGVTFMYALSRGGMNIIEVMDTLAKSDDVYGEVAKEFDMIMRDMDYFGNDLRISLRHASDITPSENFSDFLDDLLSVIDSGGEMTPFLLNKSEQHLERKRQAQKGFLETLALMAESYVTAFVAAPLFIIIITTIMSVMGGAQLMQIYAIVYFVLPLASLAFAVVIDIISTGGEEATKQLDTERETFDLEKMQAIANGGELSQDPRYKQLVKAKKRQGFKEFLQDPLKEIKENPLITLIFTVPIALILDMVIILTGLATPSFEAFLSDPVSNTTYLVVLPLMVISFPLSLFHEFKKRRERRIMRELPDVLKKLSSANETGMTLTESLHLVSTTSTGILSRELKKVHNEIMWNSNLNDALISFANRLKIPRVSRTTKLITKANESSGDIREVLEVASRDVDNAYKLDRERFQNMIIYTVIIIISFLVFLFVIVVLNQQFLGEMQEAAKRMQQSGGQAPSGLNLRNVPIQTYQMIFFHASIVQAYCSGLIAGQMGEDDILSGLKYSIALTIVAFLVFLFI